MKIKVKKFPALLIQGFLALLPLIVTLYVANVIIGFIANLVNNILPLFPEVLKKNLLFKISIEFTVLLVFISLLTLFGLIVRSVIGKGLLRLIQSFISFIPGLNVVYKATEQVVSVVASEKQLFFNHPVLVEYPSPGIWAVAFNTGEINTGGLLSEEKRYTVFIPTTPNPTSGFLAVMAADKIREFDISAEDAIKLILTGGIVKKDSIMHKETI